MRQMVRKLDELGRVVIPKEMRQALNIFLRDPVNIKLVPEGVLISAVNASCAVCGSREGLLEIDDSAVCAECVIRLRRQMGAGHV